MSVLSAGSEKMHDPDLRAPAPGTVVIPTVNEASNIRELLAQLGAPLPGRLTSCEVVFVDDSTTNTPAIVEAGTHKDADLVVANTGGGRTLAGPYRVAVSRGATWLTKGLFPQALRGISDPMRGVFAIRRDALRGQRDSGALRPLGYKILLELAVRCRPRSVTEVPFVFQDRYAGESKTTTREGTRFLAHLIESLLFRNRRRHRHWANRVDRFALLANADLLLRIPLIAVLIGRLGMDVFTATALALVVTFVLRFAGTEMLVYLPHRSRRGRTTIEES
ncbi:hypothetical protein [Streptomyces sp. NPDC059909]|uniref:hypothetical protein n=1 Tax=Streptomyces sp. NPDC059909 TaxID=3346998 RepID=UPI0036568655